MLLINLWNNRLLRTFCFYNIVCLPNIIFHCKNVKSKNQSSVKEQAECKIKSKWIGCELKIQISIIDKYFRSSRQQLEENNKNS